jgi:hypothetical protein
VSGKNRKIEFVGYLSDNPAGQDEQHKEYQRNCYHHFDSVRFRWRQHSFNPGIENVETEKSEDVYKNE